jgi:hypothetical protein
VKIAGLLLRVALGDEEYERAIGTGKELSQERVRDLAMGRIEPIR